MIFVKERFHEILDDCVRREKERKCWMIVTTGLMGNISGNRSGVAGLKEGADVAVGQSSPREKLNHRKENSLKEGAM
jgi:hypothetical protein